ncbi:hypothetical protein [Streptomyces sp. NPDC001774]
MVERTNAWIHGFRRPVSGADAVTAAAIAGCRENGAQHEDDEDHDEHVDEVSPNGVVVLVGWLRSAVLLAPAARGFGTGPIV